VRLQYRYAPKLLGFSPLRAASARWDEKASLLNGVSSDRDYSRCPAATQSVVVDPTTGRKADIGPPPQTPVEAKARAMKATCELFNASARTLRRDLQNIRSGKADWPEFWPTDFEVGQDPI